MMKTSKTTLPLAERPTYKGLVQLSEHLIKVVREKKEHLKMAQEQLSQTGKLATLGTLGAEIAHELNNLLTIISAEADEIQDSVADGRLNWQQTSNSAKNIKHYAQRMRLIVDHIREYTWDDSHSNRIPVDINDVIRDSLILLNSSLKKDGIEVRVCLAENLRHIWGHRNKLESVFQNLIANARDALRASGNKENKTLQILTQKINEDEIAIKISDNGCGMTDAVQRKVFQPFFTTKGRGEGTGLGLSIAYSIIKEHQGEIFLHSEVGAGTEFTVVLPVERRHGKEAERE
jgi:C4-dicarboxylate-specific signal transduction histidine kinase